MSVTGTKFHAGAGRLGGMVEENRRYAVKRAATGLGLFAVRPFAAGRRIIEYLGPVVTSDVVANSRKRYFFELDEEYAIDGSARSNLARYINHSCRPNAEAFITGKRIWIWSKRAIKAGEQITIDYGKQYFDDYIRPVGCKCERCSSKPKKRPAKAGKRPAKSKSKA
jgi:SET domain-containing protein